MTRVLLNPLARRLSVDRKYRGGGFMSTMAFARSVNAFGRRPQTSGGGIGLRVAVRRESK